MPRRSRSTYPENWQEIAERTKADANWRCVRCGHPHDPKHGYTLTVHHMDLDPQNCAWWNLAALCQRCHLAIQAKVIIERPWMFDHTPWIKPYVAGYYANCYGYPTDRAYVTAHLDTLLLLWR